MGHAKDVWSHSSNVGADSFTIFAVSPSIVVNAAFVGFLVDENIGYKPLRGMWKGQSELSYIVNNNDFATIVQHGWLAGQEAILHLGPADSRDRRPAKAVYLDQHGWPSEDRSGAEKDMGVFVSVPREEAVLSDGWTVDISTGEYYICKDPNEIKLDATGLEAAWAERNHQFNNVPGVPDVSNIIKAYLKNART